MFRGYDGVIREKLEELIKTKEGYKLEFKKSTSHSIGREICAFANAAGGKIIIGVEDSGKVVGCELKNSVKSKI